VGIKRQRECGDKGGGDAEERCGEYGRFVNMEGMIVTPDLMSVFPLALQDPFRLAASSIFRDSHPEL
jgi:hypothetical protein